MTTCAEICARLGETQAAQRLYERLAPWHDQFTFVNLSVVGSVALYLGMLATTLGRYEQAEAHFAEALQVHERMGAPYGVACTHLELAGMVLARRGSGDLERATVLLGQVDAIAAQLGFDGLHPQTAALRRANFTP
jgi:tetratricopeptide (TPR) repeat protein